MLTYKENYIVTGEDPKRRYTQNRRCTVCSVLIQDGKFLCRSCAKRLHAKKLIFQKFDLEKREPKKVLRDSMQTHRIGYFQDLKRSEGKKLWIT